MPYDPLKNMTPQELHLTGIARGHIRPGPSDKIDGNSHTYDYREYDRNIEMQADWAMKAYEERWALWERQSREFQELFETARDGKFAPKQNSQ